MKKYIYILITAFAFVSCSDAFLETENKNNLDSGSFFKTENDLKLAVNAAYTPLAHGGMFGLEYMNKMNNLDPYIWHENPTGLDVMNFTTDVLSGAWTALYTGLFRTSDVLANVSRLDGIVKPTDMDIYKGQLKALRGMYYFYLVTWFDKPIYYDETNVPKDPLIGYANGTQEQFWNKLEEDLTFAAQNLPLTWPASEVGRITKGAANAQLGKALLYKHYHYYLRFGKENTPEAKANLVKAQQALKSVIDDGVYKLTKAKHETKADYQAALLSNSSYLDIPVGKDLYIAENSEESVWEIQYNDDTQGSEAWLPGWKWGGNLNYLYFSPAGYRNLEIDPVLFYEFESLTSHPAGYTRDPRAFATCYIDGDTLDWRPESGWNIPFVSKNHSKLTIQNFKLYTSSPASPSIALGPKKYNYPQFVDKSAPYSAPFNVRVIRYSDVLLMYAEACYQVDADADGSGLVSLNEVRSRAGLADIAALTPTALRHERIVELATEGLSYNDIIRFSYDPNFGIDLNVLFKGTFNNNKNMYFPIPQGEIDANKGVLRQNTGW